ncbi:MAG: QueT transporter family protein [Desulfurococcaceae archaeon]
MRIKYMWIIKSSIIAAIYASLVIVLAPISFHVIQIRIADSLLLLPLFKFFGFSSVIGLTIGCVIANFFSPFGLLDIVYGSISNLIAGLIAYAIGIFCNRLNLLTVVSTAILQSLVIAVIIGYGLLHLVFNEPILIAFLGVFIGSLLSIGIIGSSIVFFIEKRFGIK